MQAQSEPGFACLAPGMWIWIGIAYNIAVALILTYLVGIALTYMSPPKARPTTPADEVAMRNKIHQEAVKRSRTQRRLKVRLLQLLNIIALHVKACPVQTTQVPVHHMPCFDWYCIEHSLRNKDGLESSDEHRGLLAMTRQVASRQASMASRGISGRATSGMPSTTLRQLSQRTSTSRPFLQ